MGVPGVPGVRRVLGVVGDRRDNSMVLKVMAEAAAAARIVAQTGRRRS